MSNRTGKLIACLLAGILAVLLFGRDAVLGALIASPWIILALTVGSLVIFIVLIATAGAIEDGLTALKNARQDGTIVSVCLSFAALAANLLILAYALYLKIVDGGVLKRIIIEVPFYWLPIIVFLLSLPMGLVERKIWRAIRRARRRKERVRAARLRAAGEPS